MKYKTKKTIKKETQNHESVRKKIKEKNVKKR